MSSIPPPCAGHSATNRALSHGADGGIITALQDLHGPFVNWGSLVKMPVLSRLKYAILIQLAKFVASQRRFGILLIALEAPSQSSAPTEDALVLTTLTPPELLSLLMRAYSVACAIPIEVLPVSPIPKSFSSAPLNGDAFSPSRN